MDKINFKDGEILYASQLNDIQDNAENAIANVRGTFYVKITVVQDQLCSADHTAQEIYQAYTNGKSVYALYTSADSIPFTLPLLVAVNNSGDYVLGFAGTGATQYLGTPLMICIAYSNNDWIKWETNLKTSDEGFTYQNMDIVINPNDWQSSTRGYKYSVSYSESPDCPVLITPNYSSNLETALAEKEAYSLICEAEVNTSEIVFYCFEEKPSVKLSLQIKIFIQTT